MVKWNHWESYRSKVRALALPRVLGSVRVRLTLWYVAILALVLALSSGAIYVTEEQALGFQLDSGVDARLRRLAGTYDAQSGRLTAVPDTATEKGDAVALLLTPDGLVLQQQAAGQLTSKAPWGEVVRSLCAVAQSRRRATIEQGLMLTMPAGTSKDGRLVTTTKAGLFRCTGMPLPHRHGTAALLVVGLRSDVPQRMAALAENLEAVVPMILVLCAGSGYWLADRALRPVRAITRTAQQIGETDLSRRLNLDRGDELGELGATFDQMLARLDAAFARQRQFAADASHELRTPLTIVDLEAMRALAQPRTPEEYRQVLEIIHQENSHMVRLVDDLLMLARADSGHTVLQCAEVDLGEIVLDVVEHLAPLARRSAMTLMIGSLPEMPVWGDPVYLTRMVTNVVENALKYGAGTGTEVRLMGGHRHQDDRAGVWLQIADDGPGIAPEHLPHVCERFYRGDQARTHNSDGAPGSDTAALRPTGTGLGLAISQWIVQAHGGSLCIRSEPGHGAIVEIWLPVEGARKPDTCSSTGTGPRASGETPR